MTNLHSEVWLIMGLFGSSAGNLEFDGSILRFTLHGMGDLSKSQIKRLSDTTGKEGLLQNLSDDKGVELFAVKPYEIESLRFPWYSFGGGMNIKIRSYEYRFSLLAPANTSAANDISQMFETFDQIKTARKLGKMWKSILQIS